MTTRRALLLAALTSSAAVFALAQTEKTGALQVTYYYLPG